MVVPKATRANVLSSSLPSFTRRQRGEESPWGTSSLRAKSWRKSARARSTQCSWRTSATLKSWRKKWTSCLLSAFKYGPLQDDTAMVDCVRDDSESEGERMCAVTRGTRPKRGRGRRGAVLCVAEQAASHTTALSEKTANKRAVRTATRRRRRPAGVERAAEEAKTGFSASLCVGVRHTSS